MTSNDIIKQLVAMWESTASPYAIPNPDGTVGDPELEHALLEQLKAACWQEAEVDRQEALETAPFRVYPNYVATSAPLDGGGRRVEIHTSQWALQNDKAPKLVVVVPKRDTE